MFTENLFQETLTLYKNSECKSIALECIKSYLKNGEFQKSFVTHINKLLGSSSSRLDGLHLIIDCIEEISPDVLYEQGLFWLKSCLSSHEYSQNKELYLKALKCIIELSHGHSEFNKKLATEYLSPILDISLSNETDLSVKSSSIECLTSCLKYYWSHCKQHKKKIEEYLLGFLESRSKKLVREAAIAFIYCQKIPIGGSMTIHSDNNLSFNFRKLCVTCHHFLGEIFEHWLEIEHFEEDGIEPFNIRSSPPHYNTYLKLQYKTEIILNVLQWMIMFLSEETNLTMYSEVFNLFERGLSLHKCSKQDDIEGKYLSFNLLLVQTKLLELLNILILSMKNKIYPFYAIISEIMRDLNKNKICDCYINCSLFQEHFHEILVNLSSLVKNGLEKSLQNSLVSQMIKNNTPVEDGVKVKMHTNMVGKSSKNKQNVILSSISSKSNRTEENSMKTKLKASINSLKGLLTLIKNNTLDDDVLDKIACFLVENISLIQRGNLKAPFTDDLCQELLYKMVCLIFEHEHSNICWKYGKILKYILIMGSKNDNMNISATCRDGLRNLEKIFEALEGVRNVSVNECSDASEALEYSKDVKHLGDDSVKTDKEQNDIKILRNDVLVPGTMEIQNTHEETSPVKEKQTKIEEDIEAGKKVEVQETSFDFSTNLFEKNVSNEIDVQEDQNLYMEPILKKRKVEENGEDLFTNEFNEDYE